MVNYSILSDIEKHQFLFTINLATFLDIIHHLYPHLKGKNQNKNAEAQKTLIGKIWHLEPRLFFITYS